MSAPGAIADHLQPGEGADLHDANLQGAILHGANLQGGYNDRLSGRPGRKRMDFDALTRMASPVLGWRPL